MLSVVIPVKNMEKYIEKCILSVVKQKNIDMNKIEILICDFGSTDNTLNIAENIKNRERANIVIIKDNMKDVVEARNKGLKNTSRKYVSFLDVDDWIDENYYSVLITKLEKGNLDFVYTDFINITEKDRIESKIKNIELKNNSPEIKISHEMIKLITENRINCEAWNKVYKTQYIKENNIEFDNVNGVNGEDLLFNLQLLKYNPKFEHASNVYYYHLIREVSLGKLNDKVSICERFVYIVENLLETYKDKELIKKYIYILFVNLLLQDLNKSVSLQAYKECKRKYKQNSNYNRSIIYNIISFNTNFIRKIASVLLLLNMDAIVFYIRRKRNDK